MDMVSAHHTDNSTSRFSRSKTIIFMVLMISTFVGLHMLFARLTVGSESVKPYLLWRIDGIPHQGDYVTFPFSHPMIKTKAKYWVKYLACNEGQRLTRKDDKFYCDGIYFADARLLSKQSAPLPQFIYDDIIPKGKAFVLGDGTNSFDSRHFGLVPNTEMMINKAIW